MTKEARETIHQMELKLQEADRAIQAACDRYNTLAAELRKLEELYTPQLPSFQRSRTAGRMRRLL